MSTTAASAEKWLLESQPSIPQVEQMLAKLEARIETWQGDEEAIQGSIDAAVLLQSHLDQAAISSNVENDPVLDKTPLIPEQAPIELENEVKQQTFAALKAQLDKRS